MESLLSNLDSLKTLFLNLPKSLPLDPLESNLDFELDPAIVEDEGLGVEFNHRLEVAWESWKGPIQIRERGRRLLDCMALLYEAFSQLPQQEVELWVGGWTEKLTQAAHNAGAQIPSQISYIDISNTSDVETSSLSPTRSSSVEVVISGVSNLKPKLRQTKLTFAKVDQTTYQEQCVQHSLRMQAVDRAIQAAETIRKENQAQNRKLKDKLRKREERAAIVENDIAIGRRDAKGKPVKSAKESVLSEQMDNDIDAARKKLRRTTLANDQTTKPSSEEVLTSPKRICWQAPGYWLHILAAIKKSGGMENARQHPMEVIKELQKTHCDSGLFDGLLNSVLRRWFDTDGEGQACWSESTLAAVARECRVGGVGQSQKLAPYPLVLEGFTTQARSVRLTGVPMSTPMARAMLVAHLRLRAPHLDGMKFSDRWLHSLMRSQLDWSYRAATKASRKRPVDWEDQCLLAFLRLSRTIMRYSIQSPRLIVNADQTGISLFPIGNKTWEQRGSRQVSSVCHEEKRQYTLVVASSCGGDILPFQSVWGGSTESSLPSSKAARRDEADKYGFTYAHGDTRHWSSLQTTKEWVVDILNPYLKRVREEEGLSPKARAILYIDCWPIHVSKSNAESFLPWMAREHPDIQVLFVPAGCTGEFQPADTLLQRVVKHMIKQAALDFFAGWSTRHLKNGVKPENVSLPNDLPTLRNASVTWTLEAFLYLRNHPEVVLKSWEKCQTRDWNLSWSKLTCPEATELFFSTVASNAEFRNEVAIHEPIIPYVNPEFLADESNNMNMRDLEGVSDDISLSVDEIFGALTGKIGQTMLVEGTGALMRTGDEGDIEIIGADGSENQASKAVVSSPVFATDIAVLGGTNPAALEDLTAARTLKSSANKANGKRKYKSKGLAGSEGQEGLTGEGAGNNHLAKRTRRKVVDK